MTTAAALLRKFDTGKLSGKKTERGWNCTTASGFPFWPADPTEDDIRIEDVAIQLARQCRFNGALRHDIEIYSVAQHCCLVHDHCAPSFKLEGLLHDGPEYVIGDLIKPVKLLLPAWKPIENRVEHVFRKKFGLPLTMSPEVKEQDFLAVATEHRDLQVITGLVDWGPLPEPWPEKIEPWGVFRARDEFMKRFEELYHG